MSEATWIITTSPRISGLLGCAAGLDRPVEAVVVGDRATADRVAAAGGVARVWWLAADGQVPVEAAAGNLARLAGEQRPGLLLADPESTVLLAAACRGVGADVLTGATRVEADGGGVRVHRDVFGGIAVHDEVWSTSVGLLVDAGGEPEPDGRPAEVTEVPVQAYPLAVTDRAVTAAGHTDLGSARRIVAVGRGLKDEADIGLVRGLAEALGAEVACSRPLAEGLGWFGKDAYVGVSGQHVAPQLYVAVGISGQLQHMAGVRDAGVIVAINSDADAPIFQESDYGIVGDLYQVVPALSEAVRAHG